MHWKATREPLFTTHKWPLHPVTWSLAQGVSALHARSNALYAADMLTFLLLLPPASMLLVVGAFVAPCSGRCSSLLFRYLGEWTMLDVFGLGLFIYTRQQAKLIPIELHTGAAWLAGARSEERRVGKEGRSRGWRTRSK